MVILPYRGYVFAAEKWEHHWFLGPLMHSLDAIFVQRGEVDRKALRQALAVLKGGGYMGMAPEGTRSPTFALQQGKGGAAYLAYRAKVPLVPAVSWGQEKLFSYLKRLRRVPIRVVLAAPFEAPPVEGRAGTAEIHALSEEIMYRLAAMLPPEYRGVYSDVAEKRPDLLELYADLHNS
jgi:1-acyl-sn-glycerol-3-phosphate acyltransferase